MDLLAYFMAHAPAEPQNWFNPEMPPKPQVPNAYNELSDDQFKMWQDELPEYAPERCDGKLMEFAARHAEATDALRLWRIEKSKQEKLQWPLAWAKEMVAQYYAHIDAQQQKEGE